MKRISILILFLQGMASWLCAAPPDHDSAKLRQLAVFPHLSLSSFLASNDDGFNWRVGSTEVIPDEITEVRQSLKLDPNDIKANARLAFLLDLNSQTNDSKLARATAENLCRQWLEKKPNDAFVMCELANSLPSAEKDAEAERLILNAMSISSNDYRCWICLADFREHEAKTALWPPSLGGDISEQVMKHRPLPADLQRYREKNHEAWKCLEHARDIAPKEPEVYVHRGLLILSSNVYESFYNYYQGTGSLDPKSVTASVTSRPAVTEFREAARLSKDYYILEVYGTYMEIFHATSEIRKQSAADLSSDKLPKSARDDFLETMAYLKKLAQDNNKNIARNALEYRGFFSIWLEDWETASVDLQKALEIDSSRERDWEMLTSVALFHKYKGVEKYIALCESHAKLNTSTRNRLLLARGYFKQEQLEKAKAQVAIVTRMEPGNCAAALANLALAIRQATNLISVVRCDTIAEAIPPLLKNIQSGEEQQLRASELCLNYAIVNGLLETAGGDEEAESLLGQVFEKDPKDEDGLKIREALK